jgi:O-antigen biosynthesis protein
MDLSVVIVSFNVRDYLKQCIRSVYKASENIECEIIVVDNNSYDDSCVMVSKDFPGTVLIRNSSNKGFSAANNQGIKHSKGRYILLLNPDTIVESDTFIKCIGFMDHTPAAGAAGVRMVNGDGCFLPESKRSFPDALTAFFKVFGIYRLLPYSPFFNRYYLSKVDSFQTSPTEVISGAFMFIRREAIVKSGFLDEDYFMYGEDIDLSFRLSKTGYSNYYFPEVQIVHFKGMSTGRNDYKDIKHFYSAMRIYIRKRINGGDFSVIYYSVIPSVYVRQAIAILNRFLRITFKN